jgi:hypothetical protein
LALCYTNAVVTDHAMGRIFPVAGIVLMLSYKVTHLSSDLFEGTYKMDNSAIVVIAIVQAAILSSARYKPLITSRPSFPRTNTSSALL